MKINLKHARFIVAATFGSLLWAGCASPREDYTSLNNRPVDLTDYRADTFPEYRTGLIDSQYHVVEVRNPIINEAAGARWKSDVYVEPDATVKIERDGDINVDVNRDPK